MNIRNKFGDVNLRPRLASAQRTLLVAGEAHTFDDSRHQPYLSMSLLRRARQWNGLDRSRAFDFPARGKGSS